MDPEEVWSRTGSQRKRTDTSSNGNIEAIGVGETNTQTDWNETSGGKEGGNQTTYKGTNDGAYRKGKTDNDIGTKSIATEKWPQRSKPKTGKPSIKEDGQR